MRLLSAEKLETEEECTGMTNTFQISLMDFFM